MCVRGMLSASMRERSGRARVRACARVCVKVCPTTGTNCAFACHFSPCIVTMNV